MGRSAEDHGGGRGDGVMGGEGGGRAGLGVGVGGAGVHGKTLGFVSQKSSELHMRREVYIFDVVFPLSSSRKRQHSSSAPSHPIGMLSPSLTSIQSSDPATFQSFLGVCNPTYRVAFKATEAVFSKKTRKREKETVKPAYHKFRTNSTRQIKEPPKHHPFSLILAVSFPPLI